MSTQSQVESFENMQKGGKADTQRKAIVALLTQNPLGLHAAQVANLLNMRLTSARARLTEMVGSGVLAEGVPVLNPESNRKCTTYTVKGAQDVSTVQ